MRWPSLLLSFRILIIASFLPGTQEVWPQAPALNEGLLIYYPFNGNAQNAARDANHLTVNGPPLTADRFGVSDSSYQFGGSGFLFGSDTGLPTGNQPRTVSYWYRPDKLAEREVHFCYGAHDREGIFYTVLFGELPGDPLALGYAGGGESVFWQGFALSNWHHVTLTYDSSNAKLYINGEQVAQGPRNYTTTLTGDSLFIGAFADGSGHLVWGALDDFRVYNRALSEADVRALYDYERFPPGPRRAKARADVVNGFIVGIEILDPGAGYSEPPLIQVIDDVGSGAEARVEIAEGRVSRVQVVNAGRGYSSNLQVRIASPPFTPELAISFSKVRVSMKVVLGRTYVLESSANLTQWRFVKEFTAQDETLVEEFELNETGRYFRLSHRP